MCREASFPKSGVVASRRTKPIAVWHLSIRWQLPCEGRWHVRRGKLAASFAGEALAEMEEVSHGITARV